MENKYKGTGKSSTIIKVQALIKWAKAADRKDKCKLYSLKLGTFKK